MKKFWIILVLCTIATANAFYLTKEAYKLKDEQQQQAVKFDSFCDFNSSFACSPVLLSPYTQFFGYPFPVVALAVYPILALITIFGMLGKFTKAYPTLAILSFFGFVFNAYYIYQEAFHVGAFCPLCLLCTAIIITICILSVIGWRSQCQRA